MGGFCVEFKLFATGIFRWCVCLCVTGASRQLWGWASAMFLWPTQPLMRLRTGPPTFLWRPCSRATPTFYLFWMHTWKPPLITVSCLASGPSTIHIWTTSSALEFGTSTVLLDLFQLTVILLWCVYAIHPNIWYSRVDISQFNKKYN